MGNVGLTTTKLYEIGKLKPSFSLKRVKLGFTITEWDKHHFHSYRYLKFQPLLPSSRTW